MLATCIRWAGAVHGDAVLIERPGNREFDSFFYWMRSVVRGGATTRRSGAVPGREHLSSCLLSLCAISTQPVRVNFSSFCATSNLHPIERVTLDVWAEVASRLLPEIQC